MTEDEQVREADREPARRTPPHPVRVLVAKLGLDTHDVGAKLIAQALRDAGMEVIYLGGRNTPGTVAAAAVQEDIDVVGVSMLSGAHRVLVTRLLRALDDAGADDVGVLVGGVISEADARRYMGEPHVIGVFGPGSFVTDVIDRIHSHVRVAQEA